MCGSLNFVCGSRVGIELPTVEVRYENLSVRANCYVGNRGLPTLWNVFRNIIEVRRNFASQLYCRHTFLGWLQWGFIFVCDCDE